MYSETKDLYIYMFLVERVADNSASINNQTRMPAAIKQPPLRINICILTKTIREHTCTAPIFSSSRLLVVECETFREKDIYFYETNRLRINVFLPKCNCLIVRISVFYPSLKI